MEKILFRLMNMLVVFALVAQLACATPPSAEAVPHDADDYLALAKQERTKAEGNRNRSLRHRNGRFHSRRQHNELLELARQHDKSAAEYERMAEKPTPFPQPPISPDPVQSSPPPGQ